MVNPLNATPTTFPNLIRVPAKFINKPRNIVPAGITIPVITVPNPINFFAKSGKELNFSTNLPKNSRTGIAISVNISPIGAIASFNLSIDATNFVAEESSIVFNSFSAEPASCSADIAAVSMTREACDPSLTMLLNSAPSLAY